jgi:hypothetical protein
MNLNVLQDSKGGMDTFSLVINYIYEAWISMNVIVGLFEVNETMGNYVALQLQFLLQQFGLIVNLWLHL